MIIVRPIQGQDLPRLGIELQSKNLSPVIIAMSFNKNGNIFFVVTMNKNASFLSFILNVIGKVIKDNFL